MIYYEMSEMNTVTGECIFRARTYKSKRVERTFKETEACIDGNKFIDITDNVKKFNQWSDLTYLKSIKLDLGPTTLLISKVFIPDEVSEFLGDQNWVEEI